MAQLWRFLRRDRSEPRAEPVVANEGPTTDFVKTHLFGTGAVVTEMARHWWHVEMSFEGVVAGFTLLVSWDAQLNTLTFQCPVHKSSFTCPFLPKSTDMYVAVSMWMVGAKRSHVELFGKDDKITSAIKQQTEFIIGLKESFAEIMGVP